jgi:hypothetical protein
MESKPTGQHRRRRLILLIVVGIPLLYLVSIGACTPWKYKEYHFHPAQTEEQWGKTLLSSYATEHTEGRTVSDVSPYFFSFRITRNSPAGEQFWLRNIKFINAKDGTVEASLAPDLSNPMHLSADQTERYSGVRLPALDLPYTDYIVQVTFEIKNTMGSNRYKVELQLNRAYNERWGFPWWEAFRWL